MNGKGKIFYREITSTWLSLFERGSDFFDLLICNDHNSERLPFYQLRIFKLNLTRL